MSRINANTGRLFTDESLDLKQAVEDAIYTPIGVRRHRPNYGSLVTEWGTPLNEMIPTVYDVLSVVDGVETVAIRIEDQDIMILINGATGFGARYVSDISKLIAYGEAVLAWGSSDLEW